MTWIEKVTALAVNYKVPELIKMGFYCITYYPDDYQTALQARYKDINITTSELSNFRLDDRSDGKTQWFEFENTKVKITLDRDLKSEKENNHE